MDDPQLQRSLWGITKTGVSWVREYRSTIDLSGDFWNLDDFLEGNALTTLATAEAVTTGGVAYNDKGVFEHRIMPFPCGPNATYGQWAQYMQRIEGFGIPLVSKEPEIAATVISELFDPLEDLGPLDDTFDGGSDLGRSMSNYFGGALKSARSAQESMEAYRNAMISLIENFMLENFDYMYENHYYQFDN